jgi:hypothetical protein
MFGDDQICWAWTPCELAIFEILLLKFLEHTFLEYTGSAKSYNIQHFIQRR